MPEKSTCRQCGQEVLWIYSAAGGGILALDPKPSQQGTHGIIDGKSIMLSDHVFAAIYSGPCHTQHMATCRNRKQPTK